MLLGIVMEVVVLFGIVVEVVLSDGIVVWVSTANVVCFVAVIVDAAVAERCLFCKITSNVCVNI